MKAILFFITTILVGCSPDEQQQYDTRTESPPQEEVVYVTDTLFKETFGTFKDGTTTSMPVNRFYQEKAPYTYSSDAKFSSMTAEGSTSALPSEPLVLKENGGNNVLHFDRMVKNTTSENLNLEITYQNMIIDSINVFTTRMHKEIKFNMLMSHQQDFHFIIYRSKDGINYTDRERIDMVKTSNAYESENLNIYLDGYNFVRVKINIIADGNIDNFSVITRD